MRQVLSYLLLQLLHICVCKRFEPTWESLDTHVAPAWYDEGKLGVFMHWGLYSVPSFGMASAGSEWLWQRWMGNHEPDVSQYMKSNYAPNFKYQDFAPMWKGEFFDANAWADLIEQSGAKYYIITSKHHEGFTLWQSNVSWNWNAVDAGPHRDIIQELADAFRSRTNVHFGMYFSLFEWFHPLYLYDQQNNFTTREYPKQIAIPQMYDYVTKYRPEYIWSDGDVSTPEYWQSQEFLAWLYNDSPVRDNILVNDRWGAGTSCKHGDVKACADRFEPHSKVKFKWEDAMTMDKRSWGFRRNANIEDFYHIKDLIKLLIKTVSLGGNLLVNVGPTSDGRIIPIFQERLLQLGSWMKVNGDSIYKTKQWRVSNDTAQQLTWYTSTDEVVSAFISEWPLDNVVLLHQPVPTLMTFVTMRGTDVKLSWKGVVGKPGLAIDLSNVHANRPGDWAWSIVLHFVR